MPSQLNSRSASPSVRDSELFADLLPPSMRQHSRTPSNHSYANSYNQHYRSFSESSTSKTFMRTEALVVGVLMRFFLKNDHIPMNISEPVREHVVEVLRDGLLLTYLFTTTLCRKLLQLFVQGDDQIGECCIEGMHHNYDARMVNLENLVAFMSVKGQTRVPTAMELLSCDVLAYSLSTNSSFVVEHVFRIHCRVDKDIVGMSRTEM